MWPNVTMVDCDRWRATTKPFRCWPLLAVSLACSGQHQSSAAVGELGNGEFVYRCVAANDPACTLERADANFPDCILVGGEFRMDYELRDSSAVVHTADLPFIYVSSASERYFDDRGDFQARRPGLAGFLAFADDAVVDLIHLEIANLDSFSVFADTATLNDGDDIRLEVGGSSTLRAVASTSACDQPGGAVRVDATTTDADVATVFGALGGLQLVAQGVGTTTITLEMAGLQRSFEVVVEPSRTDDTTDPTDPTGTTGTDTDAATGTDGIGTGDTGTSGAASSGAAMTDSGGSGTSGATDGTTSGDPTTGSGG